MDEEKLGHSVTGHCIVRPHKGPLKFRKEADTFLSAPRASGHSNYYHFVQHLGEFSSDDHFFAIVTSRYCRGGSMRDAEKLFERYCDMQRRDQQQSAPDPIICNQRPTNQLQSTGDLSRPMSMTMGHSEIVSKLSESEEEMVGVHVQTVLNSHYSLLTGRRQRAVNAGGMFAAFITLHYHWLQRGTCSKRDRKVLNMVTVSLKS